MDFNWSILGWIAGLIFVYVFGLYEGRSQGYKKRKAEEDQKKSDQPASEPAKPEIVTVDDAGLLRIKNERGSFALELDGARVNPSSLSAEQRKRLIEMLNIMRPWLEGRSAPASTSSFRTSPPPVPASPTTLDERLNTFGTASTQSNPVSVQPASPARPVPQPPASRSSTIAKEDRPVAPANSIVSQIDAILQEHLAGTPLEERGIFLTQSAAGEVNVFVGLTRYNGVDEVPDPEIKSAIRAAISEWENKYTPGL
jgi:hypothetical protein